MSRRDAHPAEPAGAVVRAATRALEKGELVARDDLLAVEEPLEVRVVVERGGRRERHGVAVTMRTPGHDFELAVGFLLSEGVLTRASEVWRVAYCEDVGEADAGNVVEVFLAPGVDFDPRRFSRNVYTTSSCGVCGKTSIDLVRAACPTPPRGGEWLDAALLLRLPETLAATQPVFSRTGGLHAAALFAPQGRLVSLREDVGRHNAVDKLIGFLLREDRLPAADHLLLVSGRASFELVQKALVAGIPAMAAVGAPSSLAVELAADHDMTLVGFLRDGRFNVYAGAERLA